jgi:hypothetical protein
MMEEVVRVLRQSPADPLTLVGVAGLLFGAALIACLVPARATRVDPVVASRSDG